MFPMYDLFPPRKNLPRPHSVIIRPVFGESYEYLV